MSETNPVQPRVFRRIGGKLQSEIKPIVLEFKDRKKKKDQSEPDEDREKYSEELEDVQVMEGDVMRVAQRSIKALSKGIDTYEQERKKSAKEKKDGAIEDFLHNSAKATGVYLKEASEIPADIVEAMDKGSYRRRLRKVVSRSSRMLRLFRI